MLKQIRNLVQAGPMFTTGLVFIGFCLLLVGGCQSNKDYEAERVAKAAAEAAEEQAELDAHNKEILKGLPANCTLTYLGRYKMSKYTDMPITVVQCKGADVTTTNSSPSCGKYQCSEVNVNITNK